MVIRRAEIVIGRPADAVWARVGDFGDISWVPGAGACTRDGDVRSISKPEWDFVLVQRLEQHDDITRTFSYTLPHELNLESILGPGKIVRVMNGTLTVTPSGESRSFVTWDIDTEVFNVERARAEYQGALESVKAELEG